MAKWVMTARSALGDRDMTIGHTRLKALNAASLLSISIPRGSERQLLEALSQAVGCAVPDVGGAVQTSHPDTQLLRLQPDRVMLFSSGPLAVPIALGYPVDQTDYWVTLEMQGRAAIPALQRMCRLDFSHPRFAPGTVAQTKMEHMAVLVLRLEVARFILMCPRSYGRSFWQALERSLHYVAA